MKKKISIAAVVVALMLGVYFIFAPRKVGDNGVPAPPEMNEVVEETESPVAVDKTDEDTPEEVTPAGVEADERVRRMREVYAVLEEERAELNDRLNDLRTRMYGMELPAKRAGEVNEELMKAFMLITNPPLLGAFHEVRDIRAEVDKVERAQRKLVEIGEIIDEAKER